MKNFTLHSFISGLFIDLVVVLLLQ